MNLSPKEPSVTFLELALGQAECVGRLLGRFERLVHDLRCCKVPGADRLLDEELFSEAVKMKLADLYGIIPQEFRECLDQVAAEARRR